jgi:hypothetical protein
VHPYLERVRRAIDAAVSGMSEEELMRHPPGKWSTAEILEHLCLTFSSTAPHLQKCLDRGAPTATRMSVYQWLASNLVVNVGYLPSGRSAPEYARPKGMTATLPRIRENLAAMDKVMNACEERFGTRVRLANHPILGPLTVGQWRKFHWVHTRHHMKQIARLRQQPS